MATRSTMTPQARGSRFNHLIADVLRIWGIDADAAIATRGTGEIDVIFSLGGQRFIVEAKWEKKITDITPLAKLRTRLDQRMRGTIGVFISIAGYTDEALEGLRQSRERSVILLDRSHFEAMISGFVSPIELFQLMLDQASFRGAVYVPLLKLLAPKRFPPPVTFDVPPISLFEQVVPDMPIRAMCKVPESGLIGMAPNGRNRILMAIDGGVAEVDPRRQRAIWRVKISGCHGGPVPRSDGSIVVARGHGVAAVHSNRLDIIGGGLSDRCRPFVGTDGDVWVVNPEGPFSGQSRFAVVRLGEHLGDVEPHEVSPPHPWPREAVVLDKTRLLLVHDSTCSVVECGTEVIGQAFWTNNHCVGVVMLNAELALMFGTHGEIKLHDLITGRTAEVGRLGYPAVLRGVTYDGGGIIYMAVGLSHGETVIMAADLALPTAEFAARAFARNDSGDLAGYREQVVKLRDRPNTTTAPSAAERQQHYNEMWQLVQDRIIEPLRGRVVRLGLEDHHASLSRIPDGTQPPGYTGSASCLRWQMPDNDRIWLEAWTSMCRPQWPSTNEDDLVIAIMVAIMTETTQHTLFTRFIVAMYADPRVHADIDEACADVFTRLPTAYQLLAHATTS